MKEIAGWFPEENQEKLAEFIAHNDIRSVIEIGSFVGKSAAFFAERCERVICVDPFVIWSEGKEENLTSVAYGDDFYTQFLTNLGERGLLHKVCPIRLTSEQAAMIPNLSADLVYIDAMHDYESVANDIRLWAPRARKYICGDDYDTNWPGVMEAVDESYPHRLVYGNLWIAPIMGI